MYNSHRLKGYIGKLEANKLSLIDYGSLLTCLKEVEEELARLNAVREAHRLALEGIRDLSIARVGLPPEDEGFGFMGSSL